MFLSLRNNRTMTKTKVGNEFRVLLWQVLPCSLLEKYWWFWDFGLEKHLDILEGMCKTVLWTIGTVETKLKKLHSGNILVTCQWPFLWYLAKIVTIFCPCPKNIDKSKLKNFGLMTFVKEIARQPNSDPHLLCEETNEVRKNATNALCREGVTGVNGAKCSVHIDSREKILISNTKWNREWWPQGKTHPIYKLSTCEKKLKKA